MPAEFRHLLHGLDTVQCAYYLGAKGAGQIDFIRLRAHREQLRDARFHDPAPILLGGREFLLAPYGSKSGFPFVIDDSDCRIEFGEFNNPSFFVTFRSEALWREPVAVLHSRFLEWAASIGYAPIKAETLSRVDFCFDYHLKPIDFDEESFVTLSSKDSQHREDGQIQTFTLGKGNVVLRVYDKIAEIAQQSAKVWFFPLWGQDHDVWRIEWQVRKDVLRRFAIFTIADLIDQSGDVLRYLASEHDTLRVPTADTNRSRWPLHPLWVDLQECIAEFNAAGIYRDCPEAAVLQERMQRMVISVYGYLKRIGAVHAIQHGTDTCTFLDALARMEEQLKRIHNPLDWQIDVAKRTKAIRLGRW